MNLTEWHNELIPRSAEPDWHAYALLGIPQDQIDEAKWEWEFGPPKQVRARHLPDTDEWEVEIPFGTMRLAAQVWSVWLAAGAPVPPRAPAIP